MLENAFPTPQNPASVSGATSRTVASHLQLTNIVLLGVIPAVAMLLCTFLGLRVRIPKTVAGALQHFAAGVVLSAVATELMPALVEAHGPSQNIGLTIGFILGMALLILLGIMMPEAENDDHGHDGKDNDEEKTHCGDGDTSDGETTKNTQSKVASPLIFSSRRESRRHQGYTYDDILISKDKLHVEKRQSDKSIDAPSSSGAVSENQALLSPATTVTRVIKPFPTQFLIAIVVDSFMDGLLIGIASAAGPTAGPMMSASLSVEMAFLGLTLATALHGLPTQKSIPAAVVGPFTIVLGSACGGLLSGALHSNPALFAGMMGFGTSALLFMVAEELLLEAHEDGSDHIWWIDLQLYVGFYVSFMSAKLLGQE